MVASLKKVEKRVRATFFCCDRCDGPGDDTVEMIDGWSGRQDATLAATTWCAVAMLGAKPPPVFREPRAVALSRSQERGLACMEIDVDAVAVFSSPQYPWPNHTVCDSGEAGQQVVSRAVLALLAAAGGITLDGVAGDHPPLVESILSGGSFAPGGVAVE